MRYGLDPKIENVTFPRRSRRRRFNFSAACFWFVVGYTACYLCWHVWGWLR